MLSMIAVAVMASVLSYESLRTFKVLVAVGVAAWAACVLHFAYAFCQAYMDIIPPKSQRLWRVVRLRATWAVGLQREAHVHAAPDAQEAVLDGLLACACLASAIAATVSLLQTQHCASASWRAQPCASTRTR